MAYTTIDDPTIYFNTVLFTGNNSANNSITGVGFQPDWIWFKNRDAGNDHALVDAVRGRKAISSNNTNAELTLSADKDFQSFDSDGFTVDVVEQLNSFNKSGDSIVTWNWKAGGSASSNSDGTVTTSVSSNTTAGFSIVSYTGNGSATQTIGHGLGAVPKVMIFKRRNSSSDWIVYHVSRGATKYIPLNGTSAGSAYEPYFANTEPTSSVFTVDTAGDINGSSDTFIAYLFSEIKGYSKFGIYKGNGNADGPFVYTGFKPAWLMLKRTDTTGSWQMYDNKRNPHNVVTNRLGANLSSEESTSGSIDIDFLSNGFKMRNSTADWNASGGTYIYMAFAESPFVNSNGVPNNAR